jgi:hypothetical protein
MIGCFFILTNIGEEINSNLFFKHSRTMNALPSM